MAAVYGVFKDRMSDPIYRRKFIHTLCLFYAFILMGICSSQTGPALLDLQLITNTNTEQASVFITGGAIGSMIGSLTMGFIFGRWNKVLMMSLTLLGGAATVTSLPWCSSYVLMIVMHGLVAVFRSAFNTGGNADLIRTWESERRVFLQILHFCFALGGTIAPLITQPFLAKKATGNETHPPSNLSGPVPLTIACVDESETPNVNDSQFGNYTLCEESKTRVQYAYLITGALFLLGAIIFCVQDCCFRRHKDKPKIAVGGYDSLEEPLPLPIFIVTLGFILLIYFFLVAVETSLASFILTFVVTYLDWTKTDGANLTSVFWGCYAAWRFATIFFTEYVSPFRLLIVTSCVMLASSVGVLMSSIYRTDTGVWICVALSGLSLASQFPSTMMWLEESVIRLSPKIVSLIVFACTLPGVVNPLLIGYLMEEVSALWLFYLISIECGVCLVLVLSLYMWNRIKVNPTRMRMKRPDTDQCDSNSA